jgi:hypothetical protein
MINKQDLKSLKHHVELFAEALNSGDTDNAEFHGRQIASYVKCGLEDQYNLELHGSNKRRIK